METGRSSQRAPEAAERQIRVIIADPRAIVTEGIRQAVRSPEIEIAAVCQDLKATFTSIDNLYPDIVVASSPFIRALLNQTKSVKLVVIVDHVDEETTLHSLLHLLTAGAAGIVSNTINLRDLLACVLAVASGALWIESKIAHFATGDALRQTLKQTGFHALTTRQKRVAQLVASGLRNKEVARELAISEGTVKVHLHKAYTTLGVSSRDALGRIVRHGLLIGGLSEIASKENELAQN
jgi:DNA-binding NarL/FixJ family response regulator